MLNKSVLFCIKNSFAQKRNIVYIRIIWEKTPNDCLVTLDTSRRCSFGMFCSPGSLRQSTASDSDNCTCARCPGAREIFNLPTSMFPGAFSHLFAMYLGTFTSQTPRPVFDKSNSRSIWGTGAGVVILRLVFTCCVILMKLFNNLINFLNKKSLEC